MMDSLHIVSLMNWLASFSIMIVSIYIMQKYMREAPMWARLAFSISCATQMIVATHHVFNGLMGGMVFVIIAHNLSLFVFYVFLLMYFSAKNRTLAHAKALSEVAHGTRLLWWGVSKWLIVNMTVIVTAALWSSRFDENEYLQISAVMFVTTVLFFGQYYDSAMKWLEVDGQKD